MSWYACSYRAHGVFSFLPRQPIHSLLAGRHASRIRGRGLNFEEIRGYLPGDDIRSMDWKVTARTRSPRPGLHGGARPDGLAAGGPAHLHVLREPGEHEVRHRRGGRSAGSVAGALHEGPGGCAGLRR